MISQPVTIPEDFNESIYLKLNPDVRRAVASGMIASGAAHYNASGRNERRNYQRPLNEVTNYDNFVLRIETTNHCNYKCAFCPHSSMKRAAGFMKDELYGKIMDESEVLEIKNLDLRNFGEPLLDKKLPYRVRCAKAHGFRNVLIHTNGHYLTRNNSDALFGAGIDTIILSLSPELEFKRTRGPFYKKIIDNLESIEPVHKKNIVIDFINTGASTEEEVLCFRNAITQLGYRVREEIWLHNWAIGTNCGKKNGKYCHRLWSSITVLYDGRIALCCLDYEGKAELGDLSLSTLSELINSDRYKTLREDHLEERFHFLCEACDMNIVKDGQR